VTERRRAEEALRRSEAWLAQAQRLSRTGTWVMWGRIHPDDRERLWEEVQEALREQKAEVELEGRQSDSHSAGAKNVRVCVAEERPIAFRYKTQRLRSGCPCLHEEALADVC
jgi:hypothetical protein